MSQSWAHSEEIFTILRVTCNLEKIGTPDLKEILRKY